jgi:hypothetical protein
MTKNFWMAFATVAALMVSGGSPAQAEIEYPWCALYGRHGTEATNCGFSTYHQCLATISGVGGYCARNPRYQGRAQKPRRER